MLQGEKFSSNLAQKIKNKNLNSLNVFEILSGKKTLLMRRNY
jgi:hypothetical protein